METKYSLFDYKKVLAILKQMSSMEEIKKSKVYGMSVISFEDKHAYQCFDAIRNLPSEEYFSKTNHFALIYATFYAGEDVGAPLFAFLMGQSYCEIITFDDLTAREKVWFKEVTPFDYKDASWEKVLASFIKKVRIVLTKKLIREETLV